MKIGRAKALWKVPELWKNQKAVFPQLLGPSVHTSHNAGCYWTFLKHNFSSTPPSSRGEGMNQQKSAAAIVASRERSEGPNVKHGSRTTDLDASQRSRSLRK